MQFWRPWPGTSQTLIPDLWSIFKSQCQDIDQDLTDRGPEGGWTLQISSTPCCQGSLSHGSALLLHPNIWTHQSAQAQSCMCPLFTLLLEQQSSRKGWRKEELARLKVRQLQELEPRLPEDGRQRYPVCLPLCPNITSLIPLCPSITSLFTTLSQYNQSHYPSVPV